MRELEELYDAISVVYKKAMLCEAVEPSTVRHLRLAKSAVLKLYAAQFQLPVA